MTHYLDYAATSAVRPPVVAEAVAAFLGGLGGTPGRGGHTTALEAGRVALRARRAVQELLGLPGDPGRLAFGLHATQALNTALHGVLGQGDAVVVTPYDHNAVRRPLAWLARHRGVEVRTLPGDPEGVLELDRAEELLDGARLLVVTQTNNVLGTVLPLETLAGLARAAGALTLVDTAQSAGHLPVRPAAAGADLVAFTGHKGMLGPQGVGGLWVRPGVEVEPLLRGGTGGDSRMAGMPEALPDRLEAGTLPGPALAGLEAGVRHLLDEGVEQVHRRVAPLKQRLREGLEGLGGVRVLSPEAPEGAAIVTVVSRALDPARLAERLDREGGVQVRSGLHCAPGTHDLLGTSDTGAVRFSLGWGSTPADVDAALAAMEALAASPAPTRI